MAMGKSVKIGGAYYKGHELLVSSSAADYVVDMVAPSAAAINSVNITPDMYGAGDKFTLTHLTSDTAGTLAILAEDIYNPGANAGTAFDFPALEKMNTGESLRLTYTNTASVSGAVHIVVEYVGISKTS